MIKGLKIDEKYFAKYELSDDALHPCKEEDYYEWWYFDAKFDNGYSCALTLHWRNGFIKPHLTTMQMYIYSPEGKKYEALTAINPQKYTCTASTEKCDVVFKDSFCRVEDDGRYHLKMQAKGIAVDLFYTNTVPPIKRGPAFLPPPEETHGIFHGWVMAMPMARVEGTLTLEEQVIPVKGEGYHDHNWGNANMGDGLRGWSWGRLFDDQYTIVYSWILPWFEGTSNRPEIYICKDNQVIVATPEVDFKVTESQYDPETKKDIPLGITLSGQQGDIKFSINLKKKEIVQSGLMQKVEGLPQYYFWRFIDSYVADIEGKEFHDRTTGTTIREYMLLNIE